MTAFSETLFKTTDSRARSIGPAFRLEPRVIDVLAEAENRASIVFQTSRHVSALSARLKRDLNLPLWNALCTGMIVTDHVEYVHVLSDARLTQRSIVVCKTCDGDEAVAEHVVGIIAVPIPQLFHLHVRVRQAGVVFASAEQRPVFDNNVWKPMRRISGKCILKGRGEGGRIDTHHGKRLCISRSRRTRASVATSGGSCSTKMSPEVSRISSRSSGASVVRNMTVSMSGSFAVGAGAAADDAATAADEPGCDCCCACCCDCRRAWKSILNSSTSARAFDTRKIKKSWFTDVAACAAGGAARLPGLVRRTHLLLAVVCEDLLPDFRLQRRQERRVNTYVFGRCRDDLRIFVHGSV